MELSGTRRGIFGWVWTVSKWSGVGVVAVLVLAAVLWYLGAPPREDYQAKMISLFDTRFGAARRDATQTVLSWGQQAVIAIDEANAAAKKAYERDVASIPELEREPWPHLVWMEAQEDAKSAYQKRRTAAVREAYERLKSIGFIDQLRSFKQFDCLVRSDIKTLRSFNLHTSSLFMHHIVAPVRVRWEDAMIKGDESEVLETARDLVQLVRLSASEGFTLSILFSAHVSEQVSDSLVRRGDELVRLGPEILRQLLDVVGERPPLPPPHELAEMSMLEEFYALDLRIHSNAHDPEKILQRIMGKPRMWNKAYQKFFDASTEYIETDRRNRPAFDDLLKSYRYSDVEGAADIISSLRNRLDQVDVVWSGIRLKIALSCYKSEYGSYPETLDSLVPAILPALPQDQYAAHGSFKYKLIDAKTDPYGRGYLLWSVGGDGVDNNGTPRGQSDFNIRANFISDSFGYYDHGVDYVLNLPIMYAPTASQE